MNLAETLWNREQLKPSNQEPKPVAGSLEIVTPGTKTVTKNSIIDKPGTKNN